MFGWSISHEPPVRVQKEIIRGSTDVLVEIP